MVRTESAIRRHHGGSSILDVADAKLPKLLALDLRDPL